VTVDLVIRSPVDQRADVGLRVEPVTDAELCHAHRHGVRELRGDLPVDEDAVGAHAGLAGAAKLVGHEGVGGRRQVGVVEHEIGRVAPQFEREPLDVRRDLGRQQLADLGRSGEADDPHRRVAAQDVADGPRRAEDEVRDPRGQADALEQVP
jgi:hypothetical protein